MPDLRFMSDREGTRALNVTFEPSSRDPSAARRRYRHGTAVRPGRSFVNGGSLPVEIRNGLPSFKPYIYRGVGYDIYSGEGDDDA